MCGIVGAVGKNNILSYIITGLKRLEYRGYDSSGISFIKEGSLCTIRSVGKISELEKKIDNKVLNICIGHTRWATHGSVCEKNAHPHSVEDISVVHNGIIENFVELKKELKNVDFKSDTDTEVISQMLNIEYKKTKDELKSIINVIGKLKGMFSLAIMFKKSNFLYAVKYGTPLVIGKSEDSSYIASDIYPLIEHASRYLQLQDNEIAKISEDEVIIYNNKGKEIKKEFQKLNFTPEELSKGNYNYYMEKEINEQPKVVMDILQDRLSIDRKNIYFEGFDDDVLKKINKIYFVACGSSWHASLISKYWFEKNTKIPVCVELASEFRYSYPVIDKKTLIIFISQSGETADTLAACREAKKRGAYSIAICNKLGSSLSVESDYTIFTQAGVEIGVAATKSFTAQMLVCFLFSIFISKKLGLVDEKYYKEVLQEIVKLPLILEKDIKKDNLIQEVAKDLLKFKTFLFIGRGVNYPIALEGALKLKEISYLHAEGYAAGELKHGPLALVDKDLVLIAICPKDKLHSKTISNIEEVRARGATIVSIGNRSDSRLGNISKYFLEISSTHEDLIPFLEVIQLQILSLFIAINKGTDVDKPRNLAKSVTVE